MNKLLSALFVIYIFFAGTVASAQSCGVSAVYGGGPFYKTPAASIPEIRASGFTTAVIWTIHIDTAGNFNYNAEFPLVANGQYTGHNTHPDFPQNVALLKTQPTSVTRIEAGLSAWGSATFQNIKNLINAHGTGPTTNLYRNFKVLRDSIPQIDAINFDDEVTYDVSTSVQFALMLGSLGYKVTLCPYTNATYWTSVASQTNTQAPGTVDAVFLQCYDGGAGNSPCSATWNFGNIPVYPGLWDANYSPSGVQTKMTGWKNQCGINGGFMWLYDDFKNTVKTQQYANAINTAVGIGAPAQASGASPADGAGNISLQASTSWSDTGTCAQSYNVYFGTTNPPPFVASQTTAHYNPGTLLPQTTYYWRIDTKNYFGTTTGNVWKFKTGFAAGIAEPEAAAIGDVYPNPFTDQVRMDLQLPSNAAISISVLDLYGHEVYAVTIAAIQGKYSFTWDGTDQGGQQLAAGVYYLKIAMTGNDGTTTVKNRKLLLVR
jgi:hypothetical protein